MLRIYVGSERSTEEQILETRIDHKMELDIKHASSVLKVFSGEAGKVIDYVQTLKFYNKQLKEAKPQFVEFVYALLLKGKAKAVFVTQPVTLEEVCKTLLDRFKPRETVADISGRIGYCTQGNRDVSRFVAELETLGNKLVELQIAKQEVEAKDVLVKINDEMVLSALKAGLRPELQGTVIAARPADFRAAVETALEAETAQKASINSVNNVFYGRNNFRGNFRGNPQSQQRTENSFRGYFRGNNFRGNYGGNSIHGNNFRGRGNTIRGQPQGQVARGRGHWRGQVRGQWSGQGQVYWRGRNSANYVEEGNGEQTQYQQGLEFFREQRNK